jgi:hypothetical protein
MRENFEGDYRRIVDARSAWLVKSPPARDRWRMSDVHDDAPARAAKTAIRPGLMGGRAPAITISDGDSADLESAQGRS